MSDKPELLANYHCHTGENPLWDPAGGHVYWVDIPKGRLYRHHVASGRHEMFHQGEAIGGFTLQEDGTLLLFQTDKISRLFADGRTEVVAHEIDGDMARFNDVIADPRGRVFAGTIGKDPHRGGLYRVEIDGTVTCMHKGTRTANGMGFTVDRKRFYWTDSTGRTIVRFDYDADSGALVNRTDWVSIPEGEGVPDGLTVDAEDCVWSARWDGYAVYRYSPEGRIVGKIPFPVAKVSSVMFGGPELDTLYVTTAGGGEDADTPDGALFRVEPGVKGLPEFRSRVRL